MWKAEAGKSLCSPAGLPSEFQETTQGDPVLTKAKRSVGVFVHIFPYIATLPGDHDIDVISSLQLAQYIQ